MRAYWGLEGPSSPYWPVWPSQDPFFTPEKGVPRALAGPAQPLPASMGWEGPFYAWIKGPSRPSQPIWAWGPYGLEGPRTLTY